MGSSVLVGLEDQAGPYTTYLATGFDVAAIPVTIAIPSSRLLDTRSAAGRSGILASGGGGLDSSGRLKAGAYIDVAVDAADSDFTLDGVFLNLTSTGSTGNGYLYAYPPGPKPVGSTTTYSKGVATSSSCLAAVGVVQDYFAVRIFSAALTHVVVDLTGVTLLDIPGPQATATVTRTARRSARRPAARRLQRTLGAGRR